MLEKDIAANPHTKACQKIKALGLLLLEKIDQDSEIKSHTTEHDAISTLSAFPDSAAAKVTCRKQILS